MADKRVTLAACACGQDCQLLTVRDVAALLKLHVRTVWRLSALAESGQDQFPKPVRLGEKTMRWRATEIAAYLDQLAKGVQA